MNAIDTNLYNYLDDKWKSQYDSWSNNTAGYSSFADVMASTSEGQLYLDQLISTGAISTSMYSTEDSGSGGTAQTSAQTSAATSATASVATASDTTVTAAADETSGSSTSNYYDFTTTEWQDYNVGKMELYNQEPGLGVFLTNFPEYGSLFVGGTVEQAASVCASYEQSYAQYTALHGGLDVTT